MSTLPSSESNTKYLLAGMSRFRTLSEAFLALKGERDRGVTFLRTDGTSRYLPYGDLVSRALNVLGVLQRQGVEAGSEAVFQLGDEEQFVVAFWACILGRIIPVPVTLGYHEEVRFKLARIMAELNHPFLIIDEESLRSLKKFSQTDRRYTDYIGLESRIVLMEQYSEEQSVAGIPVKAGADDLAFVQYSSGSTGNPKGVMLSHRNLLSNIKAVTGGGALSARDSCLSWMPMTHDMGLIGFHLTPLVACLDHVLIPPGRFLRNPLLWLQTASDYGSTLLSSPNFGFRHVLNAYRRKGTQNWNLARVRLIFNGAEPISLDLSREFLEVMSSYDLKKSTMFPVYGLAEASLAVSFPPVEEELRALRPLLEHRDRKALSETESGPFIPREQFVDLGFPVSGCQVRICDQMDYPLEEDRLGFIQIRGINVTRGYYQNETATRKAMTPDQWFRTGDLGFLRDGRLVVTGRAKDVIFRRGQNFYSHDLERVIGEVEGTSEEKVAVCGCPNSALAGQDLVAFIQFRGPLESFAALAFRIKKYLGRQTGLELEGILPVARLPRTTSGKRRRFILVQQYLNGGFRKCWEELQKLIRDLERQREVSLLKDPVQKKLAGLWAGLLKTPRIGPDDNFFELGGDSLKAGRLAVLIGLVFHCKVPLRNLFEHQTLAEMAKYLDGVEQAPPELIHPTAERELYPLSSEQKRLFFLYQLDPEGLSYNICKVLDLKGRFSLERMAHALEKVVSRHEILRTAFVANMGDPVQMVLNDAPIKLRVIDSDPSSWKSTLKSMLRPFDLSSPPLFRVNILRLHSEHHILLFEIHHIVCDGSSLALLMEELFLFYGSRFSPPQPALQYRDYAIWQQKQLASEEVKAMESFWLDSLEGEPPILDLTPDFPRSSVRGETATDWVLEIDAEFHEKLGRFAGRHQVTVNMLLLALFKLLLYKYTGQQDVVLGTVLSGRNHHGLESMIGMFVKTVVWRTEIEKDLLFEELLLRVKQHFLEVHENQDYPFEKIVESVVKNRDLNRNPLFDVIFAFQNFAVPRISVGGLAITELHFPVAHSKFDLVLEVKQRGEKLLLQFNYAALLFKESTIRRMGFHFKHLAKAAMAAPGMPIDKFDMMMDSEKTRILEEFNRTEAPFPSEKTLSVIFEEAVQCRPDSVAMIYENQMLTYGCFNRMANRWAHQLRAEGVSGDSVVAIVVDPGPEMFLGIMAAFKADAGYLPINPDYPLKRKLLLLEDSGTSLVLTTRGLDPLHDFKGNLLYLDEPLTLGEQSWENPFPPVGSDHPAYLIYTSGSTGKPKGVLVEHRGLVNFLFFLTTRFPMAPEDTWLAKTTFVFDASVHDLFAWFFNGARVYIGPKNIEIEPQQLLRTIDIQRISHINFVPSALSFWLDAVQPEDFGALHHLKVLILGGESLSRFLCNRILEVMPQVRLANSYGPTEATVATTMKELHHCLDQAMPPIGQPLPNTKVFILDHSLRLLPIGVPGEICILGVGVSRGYWNRPDLNRAAFVENPIYPGRKMYRTGDLGRWLVNGDLEFLGRLDQQIKIRGYRIELGEIEAVIKTHHDVLDAAVIGRRVQGTDPCICAYFISANRDLAGPLRAFLQNLLPEFMLPSYFVAIDRLPLTPAGKLDHWRLPEPSQVDVIRAEYVAARNAIEETIVEIWQGLLKVGKIGVHDHFFELGGHSMLASQAMAEVQKRLDVQLEVRTLFEAPKVKDLANRVEEALERQLLMASNSFQVEDLQLWVHADLALEKIKIAGKTYRLWFSDQDEAFIMEKLRNPRLIESWPHFLLPRRALDGWDRSKGTDLNDEQFSKLLDLEALPFNFEEYREKYRFTVRSPRARLNGLLTSMAPVCSYDCGHHPKWYVKRNLRSVLFAEFYGTSGFDREAVLNTLNGFIHKQHLLRSVLTVEEGDQFRFQEYEKLAFSDLPVIDLSGYQRKSQFMALDVFRDLLREDLLESSPVGEILFNLVIIKLNFSDYRLIFGFDHIISDYESLRVVNEHFKTLNLPEFSEWKGDVEDKPVESYHRFTELSKVVKEDPKVEKFKACSEYQTYRNLVINLQKRYGIRECIVFSEPYQLEFWPERTQNFDLIHDHLGFGLAITIKALSSLFRIEQIPLRVLVNRRMFQGFNFYNTVGDFHDSVPVVFNARGATPEGCHEKLHATDRNFSDAGFYISNFGKDPEIYQAVFRSPFNFNYVGKIPPQEEEISLAQAKVFPFVAYPVFAYLRGSKLGFIFFHGLDTFCKNKLSEFLDQLAGSYRFTPLIKKTDRP